MTPGTQLGKWTLVNQLKLGGNGVIWKCQDAMGAAGALKLLKSYVWETTSDENMKALRSRRIARFQREITFCHQHQDCPGIVPLLDSCNPAAPSLADPPWAVFPICISLTDYLTGQNPTLERVVEIFCELAASLAILHSKSVAHRDIKPDNILLLNENPLWGDFGLVYFPEKDDLTAGSEVLGPELYLAPEMMRADNLADPLGADVYSFAKALWVAATRQRYPLPGEQRVQATRLSQYFRDRRAMHLDPLIDRCTRIAPNERPSIAEVHEDLTSWKKLAATEPSQRIQIDNALEGLPAAMSRLETWQTDLKDVSAWMKERSVDVAAAFSFLQLPFQQLGKTQVYETDQGSQNWNGLVTLRDVAPGRRPESIVAAYGWLITVGIRLPVGSWGSKAGVYILVFEDRSAVLASAIQTDNKKDHLDLWRGVRSSRVQSAQFDLDLASLAKESEEALPGCLSRIVQSLDDAISRGLEKSRNGVAER